MTTSTSIAPSGVRTIVLRETLLSMAINAAIGAGFFFAVFGLGAPIAVRAFGIDFLPQAFMVALMGSLIPALLVRRGTGRPRQPIVKRAMLLAAGGLVLAGGGALAICLALGDATVSAPVALAVKIMFGTMLAAIITPIAVSAALHPEYAA